jgi:hypothetical protein
MQLNSIAFLSVLTIFTFLSFLFYSENYKNFVTFNYSSIGYIISVDSNKRLESNNKKYSILERNLLINYDKSNLIRNNSLDVLYNSNETKKIELCPLIPSNLIGRIPVNTNKTTLDQVKQDLKYLKVEFGGRNNPKNCTARHKVAIIVPYRNRLDNLNTFLRHMHPFLSKQQIDYGIFIVEPLKNLTFNRGLLMNIGFLESLKLTNNEWQCFMFHVRVLYLLIEFEG